MNRIVLCIFLSTLFLTSGCVASKNLGSLKENHSVTNVFRAIDINPNYNYYYYGIFLEPTAIMGFDKSYQVQSKFWTPIDLTQEQLKKWITTLEDLRGVEYASGYMDQYQGSYILNPQGSVVGMWYSRLDWGVFDFTDAKTVVVYPPSLKAGSGGSIQFRRID